MKTRNQFKIMRLMGVLRWRNSSRQFCTIMVMGLLMSLIAASVALLPSTALAKSVVRHPNIWIEVTNLDTGMPIKRNTIINVETPFQVTVTNYGADCAGQFVVTALGAPVNPPSVLVQYQAFIIGPSVNSKSSSGAPLIANVGPPGSFNDWKISASCNGAEPHQRSFDFFEFFVESPE